MANVVKKYSISFELAQKLLPILGEGSNIIVISSIGIPADSEDTLRFAAMADVRPMIEKYPLAKAAEGYSHMMSGKSEFRVVLTM